MNEVKFSENGVHTTQDCPVCNTKNESTEQHCKTCAWYFPLKDTPQFAIELSRAKQQFQMVQSFNQVYQHMQIQSKVLERMSFRLDGLETDMKNVKEQNFIVVNPEITDTIEYPDLEPIVAAEAFNTPKKRMEWWNKLEGQWKKTFNATVLGLGEVQDAPTDEQIQEIFDTPTIRVVGPRGMYPNVTFEVTNLSGVKHLTNLQFLMVTHGGLTSLSGIEHLQKMVSLFVNSNKLTNINEVHYLNKLTSLYANANQLNSILPVKQLNLQTFYCNYNQLVNLHGITKGHKKTLKEFYCLPNDQLALKEIKRIEEGLEIKCLKA